MAPFLPRKVLKKNIIDGILKLMADESCQRCFDSRYCLFLKNGATDDPSAAPKPKAKSKGKAAGEPPKKKPQQQNNKKKKSAGSSSASSDDDESRSDSHS